MSNNFRKQRVVGDGVSGADMISHINAADPHAGKYATVTALTDRLDEHKEDELAHNEYLVAKANTTDNYNSIENADKLITAGAVKDINDRLVELNTNFELAPGGYSVYKMNRYNPEFISNSAYMNSTIIDPYVGNKNSPSSSRPMGYYILNGKLYNEQHIEQTADGEQINTFWTSISTDRLSACYSVGINDGKIYVKYHGFTNVNSPQADLWKLDTFSSVNGIPTDWTYAVAVYEHNNPNFMATTAYDYKHCGMVIFAVRNNTLYRITVPMFATGIKDNDIDRFMANQFLANPPQEVYLEGTQTALTNIKNVTYIASGGTNDHVIYALTNDDKIYAIRHYNDNNWRPGYIDSEMNPQATLIDNINITPTLHHRAGLSGIDNTTGEFVIVRRLGDGSFISYNYGAEMAPFIKMTVAGWTYGINNKNELWRLGTEVEDEDVGMFVDMSIGGVKLNTDDISNSKWLDIIPIEKSALLAINNGDLYYIKDMQVTRITNTKDWSSLQGSIDLAFAFKKNDGLVALPDNVITKDNLTESYENNDTKIITANVITQFRNDFDAHDHEGVYVPFDHITTLDNVHSQYLLRAELVNSGVFVQDPQNNSVPIFRADDDEADYTNISITVGNDYAQAMLDDIRSIGNARVWKAVLDYDNNHVNKFVKLSIDNNVVSTTIEDTDLSGVGDHAVVAGSADKNTPCSLYILNGYLYSSAINANEAISTDVPTDQQLDEDNTWTHITGFTSRRNFNDAPNCLAVGINNGKAYTIDSDGNINEVVNTPEGNWTALVGTLYAYNTKVWGICDGVLYVIYNTANVPAKAVEIVSEDRHWDICTVNNATATTSNYCYAVDNGRVYEILFKPSNDTATIGVLPISTTALKNKNVSISQVYGGRPTGTNRYGSLLLLSDNGHMLGLYTTVSGSSWTGLEYTPDTNNIQGNYGWTDACLNYGINNGSLFRLDNTSGSTKKITEVLIGGLKSNKWTSISGCTNNVRTNIDVVSLNGVNLFDCYYIGVCDSRAYLINGTTAIPILEDEVTNLSGSAAYPKQGYVFRTPIAVTSSDTSNMKLSAAHPTHPNKWVVSKALKDRDIILAVSTTNASDVEPWHALWNPDARVALDLSDIGFWDSVPLEAVIQEATTTTKGIVKPKEDGGLLISGGELSISDNVANIQILKSNTIPIYGYDVLNDDLVISKGLDYIPKLTKEGLSSIDTDRVWSNFNQYGSNSLGVIRGTTMNMVALDEPIVSVRESDNSSVGCNYTIVNGKLFYISYNNNFEQVGSSANWSKVCGFYTDQGSGKYTYAYAINDSKLYKLAGTTETILDGGSTGWSDICGYSSNNTPNFYAYGIRNDALYYISNSAVAAVTGKSGTWLQISGIGGTYSGQPCVAYGVVRTSDYELCALSTTATKIDSSATNYISLTGYTYLDSLAYVIKESYLYKVEPTKITGLTAVPGWTKLSGLGYKNSGCCYGICNQNLYAIKNESVIMLDGDLGWTDVCGDYSGAFKRMGYAINRGHVYSLKDTSVVRLTEDGGWSCIYGRSDVVDYVVCAKLSEVDYKLSASSNGTWKLESHDSGSYTLIANSNEPASGTDPWDCSWDNGVIVVDVISHSGWTGFPVTDFITSNLLYSEMEMFRNEMETRLDEFVPAFDLETDMGEFEEFLSQVYTPLTKLPASLQTYIANTSVEEPLPDPYAFKEDLTNLVDIDDLPDVLKTHIVENKEGEPYVTANILDTYLKIENFDSVISSYLSENALEGYVTSTSLNNTLSDYLKTSELSTNSSLITDDNLIQKLAGVGIVTSSVEYVTADHLALYVKSADLGNTLVSLSSTMALVNANLLELTNMLSSGGLPSGDSGGVTTVYVNTAIANAKKEPIAAVTLTDEDCTITPGKLYIWNVDTNVNLDADEFTTNGLEYSYLEVTIGSSGSITVDESITQVNAFQEDSTNMCIIRNINGNLRLTVVDVY